MIGIETISSDPAMAELDERIKREEAVACTGSWQRTNAMSALASWLRTKRAQLALIRRSDVWLDDSTFSARFFTLLFLLFVVMPFQGRPLEPFVTAEY